jgi:hypothetical protein
MGKPSKTAGSSLAAVLIVALAAVHSNTAHADPASKVYIPQVVYGEWEFEFRGGFANGGGVDGSEQQYVFDIGRGITSRWFSELAFFYSKDPNAGGQWEEFKSENIFVLTEPGEHWLDFGIIAEAVHNRVDGVNEIEIGPLFQKETGHEQFNLDFEFERAFNDGAKTELTYSWQWKHRGNPRLEFGLQGFGELGEVGHFGEEHSNRIGPAFFGQIPVGRLNKLKYDAGLQFGLGRDAADTTFRFQLEYEVYGM